MTTEEALVILIDHQRLRRGADIPMLEPKEIGEAIDVAIEVLKEKTNNESKVVKKAKKNEFLSSLI